MVSGNTESLNYVGNDGTCDHSWLMMHLGNVPQSWPWCLTTLHFCPVLTGALACCMTGSVEFLNSNKSLTFSSLKPKLSDFSGSRSAFLPKSAALERHRDRPRHLQM